MRRGSKACVFFPFTAIGIRWLPQHVNTYVPVRLLSIICFKRIPNALSNIGLLVLNLVHPLVEYQNSTATVVRRYKLHNKR